MQKQMAKGFMLALFLLFVSACGFSPVYGTHGKSDVPVAKELNLVKINNIPDREGQILRNRLIDRLYIKGRPANPTTQLSVKIETQETDLGIQKDATASRRELSLSAEYTLQDMNGNNLVKSYAHSVVSYSKLDAQYGTVAAQRSAYDRALKEVSEQIVNRLALYFAEGQYRTPVPTYPSFLLPSEPKE